MKNKILVALISLMISVPAFAQNNKQVAETPEMRAQKMTDDLMREVNLTEEQKEAVYEASLRKTRAESDNTQVAPETETSYDDELRNILDDQQYSTYLESKNKKVQRDKPAKRNSKKAPPAQEEKLEAPQQEKPESTELEMK